MHCRSKRPTLNTASPLHVDLEPGSKILLRYLFKVVQRYLLHVLYLIFFLVSGKTQNGDDCFCCFDVAWFSTEYGQQIGWSLVHFMIGFTCLLKISYYQYCNKSEACQNRKWLHLLVLFYTDFSLSFLYITWVIDFSTVHTLPCNLLVVPNNDTKYWMFLILTFILHSYLKE